MELEFQASCFVGLFRGKKKAKKVLAESSKAVAATQPPNKEGSRSDSVRVSLHAVIGTCSLTFLHAVLLSAATKLRALRSRLVRRQTQQ